MALYEYYCEPCHNAFEQIVSGSTDPDAGRCPRCKSQEQTRRLISRFAIGGQGDLRESTVHGCHGHFTGLGGPDHGHGHEHGHDHDHSSSDHESDSPTD